MRIRVLLAELPPILREIIAGAVYEQPDMELLGTPADGRDAIAMIEGLHPDVVVIPSMLAGAAKAYQAAMVGLRDVCFLEIGERDADLFEVRLVSANASVPVLLQGIRQAVGRESQRGTYDGGFDVSPRITLPDTP